MHRLHKQTTNAVLCTVYRYAGLGLDLPRVLYTCNPATAHHEKGEKINTSRTSRQPQAAIGLSTPVHRGGIHLLNAHLGPSVNFATCWPSLRSWHARRTIASSVMDSVTNHSVSSLLSARTCVFGYPWVHQALRS